MPDKWRKRGCGKSCIQCWKNKLKHAVHKSKNVKNDVEIDIEKEIKNSEQRMCNHTRKELIERSKFHFNGN